MYKLLTQEQKQKIENEYKLRRIVLMLALFSAAILLGIIGLFPSYIISTSKEHDAKERLEALNNSLDGIDAQNLSAILQDINIKIKLFSVASDSDRPYEGYKEIINLKPDGIELTELSYQKVDGSPKYELGGTARDRRALIEFQNNLNDSALFTNVNVPVSNLAENKDIDFNLSLDPER